MTSCRLPGDPAVDKLEEIRRLYYDTKPSTVERDLTRAVALLKEMPGEEERERATVFMEGLAEMRREWQRAARGPAAERGTPPAGKKGTKATRRRKSGTGPPRS